MQNSSILFHVSLQQYLNGLERNQMGIKQQFRYQSTREGLNHIFELNLHQNLILLSVYQQKKQLYSYYKYILTKNSMKNSSEPHAQLTPNQQKAQIPHKSYNSDNNQPENATLDFGEITLPSSMRISNNQYGHCLLATQSIKKGGSIYKDKTRLIPHSVKKYRFVIDGRQYISGAFNSVKFPQGRHAYTYDGFMNHSCDPNTISIIQNGDPLDYQHIAMKDINVGDEILCTYLQFDYECDGHQFQCLCGSDKCYKSIRGFKNLSLVDQVGLLHIVYPDIVKAWLKDNPKIVLIEDLKVPEGIQICETEGYRKLRANRDFKKGEVICTNRPLLIEQDSVLVVKVGEKYELMEVMSHTVNKGEGREFLYFGSFMNHSCEPNSVVSQEGDAVALMSTRQIEAGEEVTYDYSVFDTMSDAQDFACLCKSTHCRGMVEGRKKQIQPVANKILW